MFEYCTVQSTELANIWLFGKELWFLRKIFLQTKNVGSVTLCPWSHYPCTTYSHNNISRNDSSVDAQYLELQFSKTLVFLSGQTWYSWLLRQPCMVFLLISVTIFFKKLWILFSSYKALCPGALHYAPYSFS